MAEQVSRVDARDLITWVLAAAGSVITWYVMQVQGDVAGLQQRDREITEQMHSIQLLVAGKYVTNERLALWNKSISQQLDRIEDKLDRKQDKQ